MMKLGTNDLKQMRIGEVSYTKYGTKAIIIEYFARDDIVIRFDDNFQYTYHTTYQRFKNGKIKNPYDRTAYGIGYVGVGKFKTQINGRNTKEYNCWFNMFTRCYDNANRTKSHMRYIGCEVCKEWHDFQVFAAWFWQNYFFLDGEDIELDKDILIKGNKLYSPETCCFVPESLNKFFTKSNFSRGKYPIGVSKDMERNCFVAVCTNKYGKVKEKLFKRFHNFEDAFLCYKDFKEKCCVQMAEYYKDILSNNVYNALIKYKVEITD